ncbi:MAG: hypothetical protein A2Z88_06440 [Omnitrophica WOR_2 bacterium GWA2_47_8]|nr:MAG: hypothetical protein A2Z88_06440 [Omnitrophica WOR_2 bacterium GWA2_47_8]
MKKLSHSQIVTRQKANMKEPRLSFCVVLNNIRSLFNVGSIFRTADGAGIEKIWLCGITGYPPAADIAKTALGAQERVPWEYTASALDVIRKLKKKGYQIVALEQTTKSIPHHEFRPRNKVCLVIGHEITGVHDDVVDLCDAAIEIEMMGVKNSLNVAVAFGIAAYHIRHCLLKI